jgi:hypothetical protein
MIEPIKVNAYRIVSSFATLHECWWLLSDGETVIITKPENAIEIDREKHLYSLLYDKNSITHSFRVKDTEMIIMTDYGITFYKKKDARDDSNKENATEI